MALRNKAAKLVFFSLTFKVTPGTRRYLGGFIRDPMKRDEWLEEKTSFWTSAIGELATVHDG
jgi:hypothetical protein